MTQPTDALRLSAPAPGTDDAPEPALTAEQIDIDDLCERWVSWQATRRFYAPPSRMVSVLGQLTGSRTRPVQVGGPDALNSTELAAFHLAYSCHEDCLGKRVFDLYYVHRIAPIKRAAHALGISRPTFYRVLAEFRQSIARMGRQIEAQNIAAGHALPHAPVRCG